LEYVKKRTKKLHDAQCGRSLKASALLADSPASGQEAPLPGWRLHELKVA
jgi:hypothetical protein